MISDHGQDHVCPAACSSFAHWEEMDTSQQQRQVVGSVPCLLPSLGVPGEPDHRVSCHSPSSNRHHGQGTNEQGEDAATES